MTPSAEPEAAETPSVQPGAFVQVSTQTNVYTDIDSSGMDADRLWAGCFTQDATVQVEETLQDALGRWWYRVRYLYGDDFADGTLKWTEQGTLWVLAQETCATGAADLTVTDYAQPVSPSSRMMRMSASPCPAFRSRPSTRRCRRCMWGRAGCMAAPARTARICRSPSPRPWHGVCHPALPGRIHGLLSGAYAARTRREHLRRRPAAHRPVCHRGHGFVPYQSRLFLHHLSRKHLHAIGWVLRHTYRSWSSTMMTRTMKPGRASPDSSPSGRSSASWKGRNTSVITGTWTTSTAPATGSRRVSGIRALACGQRHRPRSMTGAISVSNQSTHFSGGFPDRHRHPYHGRGPHSRQPVLWGFDRKHRRAG